MKSMQAQAPDHLGYQVAKKLYIDWVWGAQTKW